MIKFFELGEFVAKYANCQREVVEVSSPFTEHVSAEFSIITGNFIKHTSPRSFFSDSQLYEISLLIKQNQTQFNFDIQERYYVRPEHFQKISKSHLLSQELHSSTAFEISLRIQFLFYENLGIAIFDTDFWNCAINYDYSLNKLFQRDLKMLAEEDEEKVKEDGSTYSESKKYWVDSKIIEEIKSKQ